MTPSLKLLFLVSLVLVVGCATKNNVYKFNGEKTHVYSLGNSGVWHFETTFQDKDSIDKFINRCCSGCAHAKTKVIPVCVHKVKFYMGDSYWRSYIKNYKDGKKEYMERFGQKNLLILESGKITPMQKKEGDECD